MDGGLLLQGHASIWHSLIDILNILFPLSFFLFLLPSLPPSPGTPYSSIKEPCQLLLSSVLKNTLTQTLLFKLSEMYPIPQTAISEYHQTLSVHTCSWLQLKTLQLQDRRPPLWSILMMSHPVVQESIVPILEATGILLAWQQIWEMEMHMPRQTREECLLLPLVLTLPSHYDWIQDITL